MPTRPIGFNRHALIAIREAKRLTRDTVATSADLAPSFYGRVEKGERAPSLEAAQRLAEALGCDVRALVPAAVEAVAA